MNKHRWLAWAEVFDSWRVIPRVFFAACFTWVVWLTHTLVVWYTHLPKDERGFEASGFGAVVLSAAFAFLKLVFDTYSRHGRDWNDAPAPPEESAK